MPPPWRRPELLVLQHIACEPPAAYEDELVARGVPLTRVEVDEGEPIPDWREFSGIVAMGGPMGAYEDDAYPWLAEEKRLIAEAARSGQPYWGVCLGAQLLAASLGARVYPGERAEVGVLPVRLTEAAAGDPVFGAAPAEFSTLQWHGDTFDLPDGATLLAGTPGLPAPGVRLAARIRAPVPHRGHAGAGRRVGGGARVRGVARRGAGPRLVPRAGGRAERGRGGDGGPRPGPVLALARSGA